MLVYEAGPRDIFIWLRRYSGGLLMCMYCASVWIALVVFMLPIVISDILALSTLAIVIHKVIEG